MSLDAHLPQHAVLQSSAQAPLWATLTRWWVPATSSASDTELGYESALPWTLGAQPSAEPGSRPY